MAKTTDIIILGTGLRGLWLSVELTKIGYDVDYLHLHSQKSLKEPKKNRLDEVCWQVGPQILQSRFVQSVREFIDHVLQPETQDIPVQILTKYGPLELWSESPSLAQQLGLRKFFPQAYSDLESFLACIQKGDEKLLFAYSEKMFKKPLGQRWILEWLGSLRRSRDVKTEDWILKQGGEILDSSHKLWILKDSMNQVVDRALKWAKDHGVNVHTEINLADIGVEGRSITGVEIRNGKGFINCRHLIVGCAESRLEKLPLKARHKGVTEKWAWIRCGFVMKPHSKPMGLLLFSSFVIDPFLPLVEDNVGILRWLPEENTLTVWARAPFGELKRQSYLVNLAEKIQKNLTELFPNFERDCLDVISFEESLKSIEHPRDELSVVYDEKTTFRPMQNRIKNIWFCEPSQDRGLELLSSLATEYRLWHNFSEMRIKELKKIDRTLHRSRNGESLVTSK